MSTEIKLYIPVPSQRLDRPVANHNFYGVQMGERGFITRTIYDSGKFTARCVSELSRGNGWNTQDSDSLEGVIVAMLQIGAEVIEFETAAELLSWLLGGCRD